MSNLGAGETKFVVPPRTTSSSGGNDGWGGCGGCLVLIVLFIFAALSEHNDGPSYSYSPSSYYGSLPYTTDSLIPPSSPQPQFAAFTQTKRNQQGSPQAFIFENGSIEVIRVRSEREIPSKDLKDARVVHPGQLGGISRVVLAGVFVLHGDIDIHIGDLDGFDEWKANFQSRGGDIEKAVSELTVESPRGPPDGKRKVYIVGRIANFNGPDLRGYSSSRVMVLDLSVTDEQNRQYAEEVAAFKARQQEMRRAWEQRQQEEMQRRSRDRAIDHPVEHPIEVP